MNKHIMKNKLTIILTLFFIVGICLGKNLVKKATVSTLKVTPELNRLEGKWSFVETNEYLTSFVLELVNDDNKIKGYHCIVSDSGNKSDCPLVLSDYVPSSLVEINRGSGYVELEIKSSFSDDKGIVKIELIDNNNATWKVLTEINGENYFPTEGTLKKER